MQYRIVSKQLPQAPVHTVKLSDWKLNLIFAENEFAVAIPKDAERVSFLAPPQQRQGRSSEVGR